LTKRLALFLVMQACKFQRIDGAGEFPCLTAFKTLLWIDHVLAEILNQYSHQSRLGFMSK